MHKGEHEIYEAILFCFLRNPGSFSAVNPMDVTAAHLISYDPQQDILPVVLANCQYSFEIGKGTKIEYDFDGLERQLMDRFFFSKSRINIERVMQVIVHSNTLKAYFFDIFLCRILHNTNNFS